MYTEKKVEQLINYIKGLGTFNIKESGLPYKHMGATITDAILQAGINYNIVVLPRVEKIRKRPEAKTTKGFFGLLKKEGANKLLDWEGKEKPERIMSVVHLFIENNIETEAQLKNWLMDESNVLKLKNLRGIKDKTADYFKILSGISTTAIDRHLIKFLNLAGVDIDIESYIEAREIVNATADQMKIDRAVLDYSIWSYARVHNSSKF